MSGQIEVTSMGSIVASCGHTLKDDEGMGFGTAVAATDREGERCVLLDSCCLSCLKKRRKWKYFLKTKAEQRAWIDKGLLPSKKG